MTGPEILKTTFLDLLFENRNKDYGAYALRKRYGQRLATALGISLAAAFLLGFLILENRDPLKPAALPADVIEDVFVRTQTVPVEPKAPEPPPVKQLKPASPVAQQQFTQIRITTNPVAATDVPAHEDLKNVAVSNSTTEGQPVDATPAVVAPAATGGSEPPAEQALEAASYTAPQFPGGAAAWMAFLARHLRAPDDLAAGERKTVAVKFSVSPEGRVTALQIVQSAGDAFDAEVIRVLQKMPNWKPALRNGQPVGVSFTQPVTFVSMDE